MNIDTWNIIEFWCLGFRFYLGSTWVLFCFRVVFHSFEHPTHFYLDLGIRGPEKFQEGCHNFDSYLALRPSAFQGTSNPEGTSARDTRLTQRGTRLRVWFWLGRAILVWGGRGWNDQCIISSTDISLMLSSSYHSVTLMWCRRVLRSVFFII